MKATSSQSHLAGTYSKPLGGALRSALFTWCLGAALYGSAACVPPNGSWQSQPEWQEQQEQQEQQQPMDPHDDDDDEAAAHDGASASEGGGEGGGGGGGSWTCEAVATFVGQTPIKAMGSGNTRDDAYYNAFSDCNSLMTVTMNLDEAAERRTQVVSECTVTECNQWQ